MNRLNISTTIEDLEESKKYRWHTAITLLLLFVLASLINIIFSREVKRLKIEAGMAGVNLNDSIYNDILTIGISSLIIGGICVFAGLWLSSKANLGAPLLVKFYSRESTGSKIDWRPWLSSIALATILALIFLALFEFQKDYYPVINKMPRPSNIFYALVAFSAGITEEIIFRLGLMSLIIAGLQYLTQSEYPSNNMIWGGIIISALFFGFIHLPLSKNFVTLTPFTVGVTMVGNAITGSTFGWIYWKRGLLIAMVSHIVFDLVFHVMGSPYI